MADSSIEWTEKVWNPTRGCSRISPGCGGAKGEGGCYAERQAYRFSGPGQPYDGLVRLGTQGPRWTGKVRLVPSMLSEPLRWRKPKRIFVKQLGAKPITNVEPTGNFRTSATGKREFEMTAMRLNLLNRKGGDQSEWPEDLRVRQFPETRR